MSRALGSVARRLVRLPSIAWLAAWLAGWLVACPAPAPSPYAHREPPPAPPRGAEPAPAPDLATAPDRSSLPSALAAHDVRPAVRSLWQALEAVDAGDAEAMARVMIEGGRWLPPGSFEESVAGAVDLRRAMSPWSSPTVELDVRRIILLSPLGGDTPFAVQVSVASHDAPAARHELVLLVDTRGDHIAAVHHFGDPLGPIRARAPNEAEPLDLGPASPLVLEDGAPEHGAAEAAHLEATRRLMDAVDGRDDAGVRARVVEDAVLHDVAARRTRRGRDAYAAGMRETLGETGHVAVDRLHAGGGFVIVAGSVFGREPEPATPAPSPAQEHGFADVHRMVDGAIAETWHYVNRRGRPHHPRPTP